VSSDRTAHWTDTAPTDLEIRTVTENFFGAAAESYRKDGARLYIYLYGRSSSALRSIQGVVQERRPTERWIEVWFGKEYCSVITRSADEYTSALADGLHALLIQAFKGSRDPE
jgi:hypothetical protein